MSDIKKYLCPKCKGPIAYDIESQSWKCTYCFSKYTKEEVESVNAKEESAASKPTQKKNMDSYKCSNCGAEVLADSETSATFCLYCKSPAIIKSRFEGEFEPKFLIPFKIGKEEIKERYYGWISKKKFAPDSFKYKDEVDKITGLYVPFWLFDSFVKGDMIFDCTKVRSWSNSKYNYTETKYYNVSRGGEAKYNKVPIDGLKNIEDELVRRIEPFNYNEMIDFSMEYMAGFLAEKYNVSSDNAEIEARKRMNAFIEASLKDTVSGYATTSVSKSNLNVDVNGKYYALLPIYILVNEHDGVKYKFIANGQTGKIYGMTPIVKSKVIKYSALIYLITTLIVGLGGAFLV